jgi:hypothetical protein
MPTGSAAGVLPHPFLLFLRSLNAWFNALHSSGGWPEWSAYLARQGAVTISGRARRLGPADPLVLLPSCRDMDIDSCSCLMCKAADAYGRPELYPVLPDKVWRAVTAVLHPGIVEGWPITEEEAGCIARLRRSLLDAAADQESGAGQPGGNGGDR